MPLGAILGVGSQIAGGLMNRGGQKTSSSSESRPYYTDTQLGLQGPLAQLLKKMLKGKETPLDRRLKAQAGDTVNRNYAQMGNRLDSILTQRGFGESGKHNLNTLGLELERGRTLTDTYTNLDQNRANRQMAALGQAAGIAFNPSGSNTTSQGVGGQQSAAGAIAPVVANTGGDLAAWLATRSPVQPPTPQQVQYGGPTYSNFDPGMSGLSIPSIPSWLQPPRPR